MENRITTPSRREPPKVKQPKAKTESSPEHPEFALQKAITKYLNTLPKARNFTFYNSERGEGKKTGAQQRRYAALQPEEKRLVAGVHEYKPPDLTIIKFGSPKMLFLELKAVTPYRKDGELKAGEHLKQQAATLQMLNEAGHTALFVWDLEQAAKIINNFLK